MKYPEIKISIPEPCHEDWNQMTPTEKGRFCGVCTKEVIDFSSKSDEEIVKHFTNHGNLCGRFHKTQLDRKLIINRKKRNHCLSYAASLLFPMALFSQEVKKETTNVPKTEQTNSKNFKSLNIGSLHKQRKIAASIQNDTITIKGIITDESGMPLPGASIVINGTSIGKASDFDGNYSIKVKKDDVLVFSYVGYKTISQKIITDQFIYNVVLEYDGDLEPCNVVAGGAISTSYHTDHFSIEAESDEGKAKKKKTDNYFTVKKKKWLEKREKRRAERAKRKAERVAKRLTDKKSSVKQ